MSEKIYFTKKGRDEAEFQLKTMQKELKELQDRRSEAAEIGGTNWSTDFNFEDLERQEHQLIAQIEKIAKTLNESEIAPLPDDTETVAIGHTVCFKNESGEEKTITIAGFGESNPALSFIAYNTPLGMALLGARIGDEREITLENIKKKIKIQSIDITLKNT